jgi:hypothetical protein
MLIVDSPEIFTILRAFIDQNAMHILDEIVERALGSNLPLPVFDLVREGRGFAKVTTVHYFLLFASTMLARRYLA